MKERAVVCAVADLEQPGALADVLVNGKPVVVANVEGQYLAVSGVCTHRGGPLARGRLDAGTLICPWHESRFNLQTGAVIEEPAREALACYEVAIEGEDVYVGEGDEVPQW